MDTLFDIFADEPARDGRKRPSRARPESPAQAEKPAIYKGDFATTRPILPIGTIDHTYDCADAACGTQCHDILHEDRGEWYLVCAFCGTGQWAKAIKGHLQAREQDFVLRDGRFAGLTFAEVEKQPRGLDYLKWAAESHPRDAVKAAAKKHLDSRAAPR